MVTNREKVPLGTDKKLVVSIEPVDNISMDDYDFKVEVYAKGRPITITKEQSVRKDKDNYAICVDTAKVGKGTMMAKVIAYIPDADFDDMLRTEIVIIDTNIDIV